jgi:hypothetical protein
MFSAITGGGSGTSASQLWRGIIGGALVGMGAAEDGPVIHGPYGDVKDHSIGGAASRGFQAGMNLRQQQQDRQRKQAQEDQESKIELDKATMAKAANARAQTTSIEASVRHGLDVQRLKQDVARGDEEAADRSRAKVAQSAIQQSDYFNLLNQAGAETLKVDGKPAEFDSAGDAEEAAHKQPGFYISGFLTRTTIDPSTGKLVIYKVPDKELDYTIKDPSTGDVHTVHTLPENYLRHRK